MLSKKKNKNKNKYCNLILLIENNDFTNNIVITFFIDFIMIFN
jgi:1,2-phenylacetyl-CoA epoxidase catalytic subunit